MKRPLSVENESSRLVRETVKMDGPFASAFTCPICLGFYKDPVVLKCGHALCQSCERENHGTDKKTCPECRAEYTTTKKINLAPVRKALAALPEEEVSFEVGETCIHLGTFTETAKKCPHCEKRFCAVCFLCHLERVHLEINWLHGSFEQRLANSMDDLEQAVVTAKEKISSCLSDVRESIKQETDEKIAELKAKEAAYLEKIASYEHRETAAVGSFWEMSKLIPDEIKRVRDALQQTFGASVLLCSTEQVEDLNRDTLEVDHKIFSLEHLQSQRHNFTFELTADKVKERVNQQLEIEHAATNIFPSLVSQQSTEAVRLGRAIADGSVEKVKAFFERRQNIPFSALRQAVDTESVEGDNRALVVAAAEGKTEIVRYLVENCGSNIFRRNAAGLGDMAIHAASRFDHVDTVKYLVERNSSCLAGRNRADENAFLIALKCGSFEVVKYLVEAGYGMTEERDERSFTSLMLAVEKNDVRLARFLIEEANADTHVTLPSTDDNLIHLAVRHECTDMLKYLAPKFPDLIAKANLECQCPIIRCCVDGYLTGFKILAEGNVAYLKQQMSECLLHSAATSGSIEIGRLLIEQFGAEVNRCHSEAGMAPIHFATAYNKIGFVAFLLNSHPAVRNTKCTKPPYETPLEMANRLRLVEIGNLLQGES